MPPGVVPMHAPNWQNALVAGPVLALLDLPGGSIVLDLAPEELGRLTISLAVQGDTAFVRFQAETPEAARLLSDSERQLAAELARFGMTLAGHEASADRRQNNERLGQVFGRAGRGADLDAPGSVPVADDRLVNLIA